MKRYNNIEWVIEDEAALLATPPHERHVEIKAVAILDALVLTIGLRAKTRSADPVSGGDTSKEQER